MPCRLHHGHEIVLPGHFTGVLLGGGASYVFNPYLQMQATINAAANSIAECFGEIDSSLDKGKSIKHSIGTKPKLRSIMDRVISTSRLQGFQHGAKITKAKMPAMYGRVISSAAARRSLKVNDWMNGTTKNTLKTDIDSDYILGKDRAVMAARYEAAKAYYDGVRDAFVGTGFKKHWVTMNDNACDDCLANEDQGGIDVDDTFSSGDDFPAAHQNCGCFVTVNR